MVIKTIEQKDINTREEAKPGVKQQRSIGNFLKNFRTDFGGVPKEAWPNPSKPKLGDVPEHPNI